MSYNLESIIETYKDKTYISNDNNKLISWLLGKCIAADILSNTCEVKRTWDEYDRERTKKEICDFLGVKR